MSKMIDIKSIVEELGIQDVDTEAQDNDIVGTAPILDNGLNLLYAPQNYGKSYTSIAIARETGLPTIFFDLESNGKMFVDFCKQNNVAYAYIGSVTDPMSTIKKIIETIQKKYTKSFIIIDSYSDMFPDDDGVMAKQAQRSLGDLNKYFMREVEMPVLLLDHATEQQGGGYKIEGNKSGKYKKTLAVLRLDKIGGDIKNGTFIEVERSRNQDKLAVGTKKLYQRGCYITSKLQSLMKDNRLPEAFSMTDLENVISGDDKALFRAIRDDITSNRKDGRKTFYTLKEGKAS